MGLLLARNYWIEKQRLIKPLNNDFNNGLEENNDRTGIIREEKL